MSPSASAPTAFALLGHPADYQHLADLLRRLRPNLDPRKIRDRRAALAKLFEWSPTFAAREEIVISRADGSRLRGKLVICTFLPERLNSPRRLLAAYQKTREGCRLAKESGARLAGLGGFTSIAVGAAGEKLADEFGMALTSGNSLTAALALEQIDSLLERLGWSLQGRTVAILGAGGDIGRACALALSARARRLLLIGRSNFTLDSLRGQLPPGPEVTTSLHPADAGQASLIIAATSSARPLLAEADLQPGTVVCDIGYPPTLSYSPEPRADVLAFAGGLAEMPFSLDIGFYTRLPSADLTYGCFGETMALALSDRYESYSIGRGRITLEKMRAILNLARAHGFRPAPPYRGGRPITGEMLNSFRRSGGGH